MIVRVAELGDRPYAFTAARRYAPAGAKIIGELLGEADWADWAEIALDWNNVLELQPADAVKPILLIGVSKRYPEIFGQNTLTINVRLDVDDLFGNDEMTADAIHGVVNEMKEHLESQAARRLPH